MEVGSGHVHYRWILGISLSAEEIHACLIRTHDDNIFTERFSNNMTGLREMMKWNEQQGNTSLIETLACLVYAGYNIQTVVQYLLKHEIKVWLRSQLQLKRSLKLSGDENKIDAGLIANYALVNQEKAVPVTVKGLEVEKLKDLKDNYKRIAKAILILESSMAKVALRDEESARSLGQLNAAALRGLGDSLSQLEEKISYYTFSLKLSLHLPVTAHETKLQQTELTE